MEVGRKIGTKVPPPSEGELAFGFGVSKSSGSSLNRSVEIYINGNRINPEIVLNKDFPMNLLANYQDVPEDFPLSEE